MKLTLASLALVFVVLLSGCGNCNTTNGYITDPNCRPYGYQYGGGYGQPQPYPYGPQYGQQPPMYGQPQPGMPQPPMYPYRPY